MLTPLLVHGKSTDLNNMFKSQEFWDFINLILLKHPFTNERVTNKFFLICDDFIQSFLVRPWTRE